MSFKLSKNQIERYSRQIVIKNIGALGQQKIIRSNILIIGMGGLGCPVAELLVRAGVGNLGIVDFDKISLVFSSGFILNQCIKRLAIFNLNSTGRITFFKYNRSH